MTSTDSIDPERQKAARYAWVVTIAIIVLFVILPFSYTASQPSNNGDHFDPALNVIELVGIAGSTSAFAFFLIALVLRASGKPAQIRSPIAIRRSLDQGIVLTLIYWLFFIGLAITGGDGDGIMRGWLVILYPFIAIPYVLVSSRKS